MLIGVQPGKWVWSRSLEVSVYTPFGFFRFLNEDVIVLARDFFFSLVPSWISSTPEQNFLHIFLIYFLYSMVFLFHF